MIWQFPGKYAEKRYNLCTVEPVLCDHNVLNNRFDKHGLFLIDVCTTCYERPPVLRDRICWAEGVVAQYRFYYIMCMGGGVMVCVCLYVCACVCECASGYVCLCVCMCVHIQCTVTPRYNAVVGRHLLGPPYKRGTLLDPVDLFDIAIPRQRYW